MKQAIISTCINFQTEADVTAYRGIDWRALPEGDMEYNEVTKYIVGYKNIILLGANGRKLATFPRRTVRGMAIDGTPVIIHGKDFTRIGVDDETTAAAADGEESQEEE